MDVSALSKYEADVCDADAVTLMPEFPVPVVVTCSPIFSVGVVVFIEFAGSNKTVGKCLFYNRKLNVTQVK